MNREPIVSHKKYNQLTVSGEWAKHLRPFGRRAFWKGERQAFRLSVRGCVQTATSLRPGPRPSCEH